MIIEIRLSLWPPSLQSFMTYGSRTVSLGRFLSPSWRVDVPQGGGVVFNGKKKKQQFGGFYGKWPLVTMAILSHINSAEVSTNTFLHVEIWACDNW